MKWQPPITIILWVLFFLTSCGALYNIETAETIQKNQIAISGYYNFGKMVSTIQYKDYGAEYDDGRIDTGLMPLLQTGKQEDLLLFDATVKVEYGLSDKVNIGLSIEGSKFSYSGNIKYNYLTSRDNIFKSTLSFYLSKNILSTYVPSFDGVSSVIHHTLYSAKLSLPNSVLLFKKGHILLTASPLLLYNIHSDFSLSRRFNWGASANLSTRFQFPIRKQQHIFTLLLGGTYMNLKPIEQYIFSLGIQSFF